MVNFELILILLLNFEWSSDQLDKISEFRALNNRIGQAFVQKSTRVIDATLQKSYNWSFTQQKNFLRLPRMLIGECFIMWHNKRINRHKWWRRMKCFNWHFPNWHFPKLALPPNGSFFIFFGPLRILVP